MVVEVHCRSSVGSQGYLVALFDIKITFPVIGWRRDSGGKVCNVGKDANFNSSSNVNIWQEIVTFQAETCVCSYP